MRKFFVIILAVALMATAAFAGEKAESAGETVGRVAKDVKEAGTILIEKTKEGAKKTGKFVKETYKDSKESIKDFKEGVKEGYNKD